MNLTRILLASYVFLTLIAITSSYRQQDPNLTKKQPTTVPYVDIDRYLGTWYEIAVIPFYYERHCQRTTATYSRNVKSETLRVDNTCYRNGVKHESIGVAKLDPKDEKKTNAKLQVDFSGAGFPGSYWIVRLDKDYTYAVVSNENYSHLWVLCRYPQMSETLFQNIYQDLKKDGYSVQKLVKTKQI